MRRYWLPQYRQRYAWSDLFDNYCSTSNHSTRMLVQQIASSTSIPPLSYSMVIQQYNSTVQQYGVQPLRYTVMDSFHLLLLIIGTINTTVVLIIMRKLSYCAFLEGAHGLSRGTTTIAKLGPHPTPSAKATMIIGASTIVLYCCTHVSVVASN